MQNFVQFARKMGLSLNIYMVVLAHALHPWYERTDMETPVLRDSRVEGGNRASDLAAGEIARQFQLDSR